MLILEWIVPLLIGAVALTALARRLGVPYPAFLAVGGMVLALLPNGPDLTLDPNLALALFVAPVLLDTAFDASLRDIRAAWLPIILLVLAAVAVTTFVVAVAARLMRPDMPWAAAIALGAIVAPPDATAATAILRQVRLPLRISTILEGESLLNDASALFIYRLAVTDVLGGTFNGGFVFTAFALVLPLSVVAGWLLSHVSARIVGSIDDAPSSIIIQFALTFGIWMLAERLQLSPVITIVAYAVTISNRGPRPIGARIRLPSYAVWETATFLLNVLAFVLIGLQLRPILDGMRAERLETSIGFGLVILVACVLARLAWTIFFQFVRLRPLGPLRLTRTLPLGSPSLTAFRKGSLIVGWTGMRGIVTLAAAFALPDGSGGTPTFPYRDLMLLTAFVVVLGTLLLQGLTLKPLLRWAALEDDDSVGREIGRARTEINRAALAQIEDEPGPLAASLRAEYTEILRQAESHPEGFAPAHTTQDALRMQAIDAARRRLHALRTSGEIGGEAFARLEFELDQAEMHASEG